MKDITENEMKFVLAILKDPKQDFNANSMASLLGMSRMGTLNIAKKLEKEGIISSKEIGKANFLKLKLDRHFARQYVKFLLLKEAESAHPYVKAALGDIRKLKSAEGAVLFGSVLKKHQEAHDMDVLLILDKKKFKALQKEINRLNQTAIKRIHPIFQTIEDIQENIRAENPAMLNAIKGIVAFGEDSYLEGVRI